MVVEVYKDGEALREITLGLKKLGLPDLVAAELPASIASQMGNLMNALAQSLAEGAAVKKGGELELSLRSIQNPKVRDFLLGQVVGQGRGEARLALTWADPKEGDPDNRLLQIGFGHYSGNDMYSRQQALIVDLWGAHEDIASRIQHDDELLAASRAAREKLPALRAAFNAGLPPGEILLVKATFPTSDGAGELMWVEVTAWKGDAIRGSLRNDPAHNSDLQVGQEVEVSESEVFDYIRKYPDGRREGNSTGAVPTASAAPASSTPGTPLRRQK
jgi:uncharacterized protein YegJ (DUF2314 family)